MTTHLERITVRVALPYPAVYLRVVSRNLTPLDPPMPPYT